MRRYFSEKEKQIILDCANKHLGYTKAAEIIGCNSQTVKKYCIQNNIKMEYRKKNRELNEDFFDEINTPEKAYFLGLIYTDGSVRVFNEESKQMRIQLQLRDKPILEKFKEVLNSDVNLVYDKRPGKETVGFEISNKHLVEGLISHGVIPNKTYKSNHLPIVENKYEIDFLRGLFDGDGTLSYKENYNEACIGFTNYSEQVVFEFQNKIDTLINKENSNKILYSEKDGHKYTCHWRGRRQVLKILSILYDNTTIYLQRKYDKYQKLLSTTDKDII